MLDCLKKLDKKILFILIACVILLVILGLIYFFCSQKSTPTLDLGSTEVKSFDESFCITVPNRLELTSNRNSGEFLLDLYSELNHIYIYCTAIEKTRAIDLSSAVSEDKNTYLSNKTNIRENSDITNLEYTYPCYEYSFKYLDTECNEDFYCNVVWYEVQDCFYILNFEVPSATCEDFKSMFNEIKKSFVKS